MEPWTTSQAGVPLFPRFYAGLLLITEAEKLKEAKERESNTCRSHDVVAHTHPTSEMSC